MEDPSVGRVGPPLPRTEIKLVNVEEMNYRVTDDPPKGEIWIRGPNVAQGYYKNPEKTKEDFREGGWFATGDVAEFCKDGTLRITDRIKNLVKLSHGEYIALESIESRFKNSPFVDNICVYGDSEESFLVALVVPPKEPLREWAVKNNIPEPDNHEKLCNNPKARAAVLESVIAAGKAAKVKPVELPKAVYLCPEEWTPNNNMLTAAMKLKRGPVSAAFKDQIKEMYSSMKDNS
jgi:long-chain acyl-CoA synthetase